MFGLPGSKWYLLTGNIIRPKRFIYCFGYLQMFVFILFSTFIIISDFITGFAEVYYIATTLLAIFILVTLMLANIIWLHAPSNNNTHLIMKKYVNNLLKIMRIAMFACSFSFLIFYDEPNIVFLFHCGMLPCILFTCSSIIILLCRINDMIKIYKSLDNNAM